MVRYPIQVLQWNHNSITKGSFHSQLEEWNAGIMEYWNIGFFASH